MASRKVQACEPPFSVGPESEARKVFFLAPTGAAPPSRWYMLALALSDFVWQRRLAPPLLPVEHSWQTNQYRGLVESDGTKVPALQKRQVQLALQDDDGCAALPAPPAQRKRQKQPAKAKAKSAAAKRRKKQPLALALPDADSSVLEVEEAAPDGDEAMPALDDGVADGDGDDGGESNASSVSSPSFLDALEMLDGEVGADNASDVGPEPGDDDGEAPETSRVEDDCDLSSSSSTSSTSSSSSPGPSGDEAEAEGGPRAVPDAPPAPNICSRLGSQTVLRGCSLKMRFSQKRISRCSWRCQDLCQMP